MRSGRRTGSRSRWGLLAAVPCAVALFIPTFAEADGGATLSTQHSTWRSGSLPRAAQNDKKVTICHRTNSRTNPYNQIVVAKSAAINGHASHTGPIFAPGVDSWGDIIPPIRPGLPRGLNWREGRKIRNNGCELPPDVGPVPEAQAAGFRCANGAADQGVTVTNDKAATRPAFFRIFVDGDPVARIGPVAPGTSQSVVLIGELAKYEDQTVTVEVRSGGQVIGSRVITVDCLPGPPPPVVVDASAELTCSRHDALGKVTVTNNGTDPVTVRATVGRKPVGKAVRVSPGATKTGTIDLSPYEDRTVIVRVRVNGAVVGTYTVTPDCVPPKPDPKVSVAGTRCPPPTATVTLANNGDPDSHVVFTIRVDRRVVLRTAALYGGDTTTIVADLSQYEDQTVRISVRANGRQLGSRTITVDCKQPSPNGGGGNGGGSGPIGPSRHSRP